MFDGGASRGLIRGRLVSALLVLGALGLVLLAVIVSMLENVARNVSKNVGDALGWQPPGFGILLGIVVPAAAVFLVFVLLYHYLPHHRPGWRAALLGAAVAALGHQAVQLGLGWYLSGPADFTKVYGSASAIFAAGWPKGGDPAIERLAARAMVTTKPGARAVVYRSIQRLLNRSGPFFPLIQPTQVFVKTKDLRGAVYNSVYTVDVAQVSPA